MKTLEVFTIGNQEENFLQKRQNIMKKSKADLVMLLNSDISVSNFRRSISLFKDKKLFAVTFSPESNRKGGVRYVQQANGGSSIYNRKLWNKIGGIDMIFAPYWFDDVDYSKRAHDAGYFILEDGRIKVEQTSKMGTEKIKGTILGRLIYWRNFFLFQRKHQIPLGRKFLIIPFFWPIMAWAKFRFNRFYEK